MRIVKRQELCTLPEGTLSAEYGNGSPREWSIFYGAIVYDGAVKDFWERGISVIGFDDPGQLLDRQDAMKEGAAFPVNPTVSREGFYDDSIEYLVYEHADIVSILADVTKAYPGAAEEALGHPFGWAQTEADRREAEEQAS